MASRGVAASNRRRQAEPAALSALAPVRAAMLRGARDRAAAAIQQARIDAEDLVAEAAAAASRSVAEAAEAGRRQAIPLAAARRNRARRDAQSIRLGARREAYERFQAQVRAAVSGLRHGPGYDLLERQLRELATSVAGPGATLTEAPGGGVIARTPGIVVDCSLPRLADAAVAALGPLVTGLWAPEHGRG